MPTARQPCSLASWPTTEPTAPDAAETTTVSAVLGLPICIRPHHAVMPGMPSTDSAADNGIAQVDVGGIALGLGHAPAHIRVERHPDGARQVLAVLGLGDGRLDDVEVGGGRLALGTRLQEHAAVGGHYFLLFAGTLARTAKRAKTRTSRGGTGKRKGRSVHDRRNQRGHTGHPRNASSCPILSRSGVRDPAWRRTIVIHQLSSGGELS